MGTFPHELPTIESMGGGLGPATERQFETICRTLLRGGGFTSEGGFCRIVTGAAHPLGNFAVVSDPTDAGQTRRAMEPLCGLAVPSAVVFTGAASEEVSAVVAAGGYGLAESMPAMAVSIERLSPTVLPAGCAFVEVDRDRQGEAWNAALAEGYGIPPAVAELFGPGAAAHVTTAPDGAPVTLRHFAVIEAGAIISTSMLFLEGGLAGIYCVSTLPDHRGRGLGAFATAEPLRRAAGEGYRVGVLQSSAMGESVYRGLGFGGVGVVPLWVRMPE